MPAETTRTLTRLPALDGVRAIAVLLVLCAHAPTVDANLTDRLPHGDLGVDIFFVLSGFLITSLLLKEQGHGRVSLRAFYKRRALRLLPALLALVAVYAIYAAVTNLGHPVAATLTSMVFYYANWRTVFGGAHAAAPPGLGHMWSLSIEEQFYMVWPAVLIVAFGLRRDLSIIVLSILAVITAVSFERMVLWNHGTLWLYLYVRTDTRFDALLIGALLAILWVRGRTPTRFLPAAALVSVVFFAWALRLPATDQFFYRGGYTLIAFAVAIVLLAILEVPLIAAVFSIAPLGVIGRVSYGLYLWHFPVFLAVHRYATDMSPGLQLVVALVVSAAVTTASWYVIERPFLRLKDRGREVPPGPTPPRDTSSTGSRSEVHASSGEVLA